MGALTELIRLAEKDFSLEIIDFLFWKSVKLRYYLGRWCETFMHNTAAIHHKFMSLCNSPEHECITPTVNRSRKADLLLEMAVSSQKHSE